MKRSLALVLVLVGSFAAGPLAFAAELVGDDGPNVLTGTGENDALYGRGGNDSLRGERGNDDLDGDAGADDLRGGPGVDAASYDGAAGVQVTVDGAANDGHPGEGDNVHTDVEAIYGGSGADTLVATEAATRSTAATVTIGSSVGPVATSSSVAEATTRSTPKTASRT